jgi:putative endonuclease
MPRTSANIARGRWGEDLAAREYERRGYRVVDRNWRSPTGELDLIVTARGIVVFCEVKTRRTDAFGVPAAAVGIDKQRRIRRLAIEWLDAHRCRRVDIRFDVAAITGTHIQIIEAAF